MWGLHRERLESIGPQKLGKNVSSFIIFENFSANLVFTMTVTVYLTLEVITSFFQPPIGATCSDLGHQTWHLKSVIWLDTL